jgi:cell division protein FtsB
MWSPAPGKITPQRQRIPRMSVRQKILLALAILAMFNLLLIIVFGEKGLVDLQLMKQEHSRIHNKNEELTDKNARFYREIDRLKNDPDYVEDVAREELGMVGEKEVIFKVDAKKKNADRGKPDG